MRNNRGYVENQHNRAVAEDGSAADDRGSHELIFESLYDQFLFAHQTVHGQAKSAAAAAYHDHKDSLGLFAHGARPEPVQTNECEDLFAQLKHFVVVNPVNALLGDAGDFRDGAKRHGVKPPVNAEQKRADARESKRHEQSECGASPLRALEFDRALEGLERGFHHVEADAAPGNLGDFVRSAESRSENQLEALQLVEPGSLFRGNDPALDGAADDFFAIESAAVVGDFDDDLIAVMVGVQPDGAARRFSGCLALGRGFNAMVGGVADQVRHGVGEGVENTFVEISGLPRHFKRDFLVAHTRHVADNSRETAEKLLDGNHANFHHRFLQLSEHARLKGQRVGHLSAQRVLGMAALEFRHGPLEHGFSDDHLADQIHHRINAAGIHAEHVFGGRVGESCGCGWFVSFLLFDWNRSRRTELHAGGER